MTAPLHVLVYGSLDSGVTDTLRVGALRQPLLELGVELRAWSEFGDDILNGVTPTIDTSAREPGRDDEERLRQLGLTALAWADVLLFRRWRSTHTACIECESVFSDLSTLARHLEASGHRTIEPDLLLRPILELLAAHPELLGDRGVVYDTDDDVLAYPDWTGFGPASRRERDATRAMIGLADLVVASTPVLAERLTPHARGEVSVIRNAIDPRWYPLSASPSPGGDLRVVYHGVPVRLRDYAIARPAVDALAASCPSLRRVWLGAAEEPRVRACMDEVYPWVDGAAAFASALTAARPDIGLAPLVDEPFNRAKSELHWLEYAMAGAPTIVSGFAGPGPFDVVRDGLDGLVAYSLEDWRRHLSALAGSPGLRSDLASRARERVLAEYTVTRRAEEWREAFAWAANHPAARAARN